MVCCVVSFSFYVLRKALITNQTLIEKHESCVIVMNCFYHDNFGLS